MTELEELHTRDFLARNRIAELQEQLSVAERRLDQLSERLTLSQQEKAIFHGRPDGCVRVNDLRPIVRRVFGEG
jgi:hypothetical protein